MPHIAGTVPSGQTLAFRFGLSCALAIGLLALGACWVVLGGEIPFWVQPSAVGAAWGMLFLTGLHLGTTGQYRLTPAAISLIIVWLVKSALQELTDLNGSECCLLVCLLTTAGWLTSRPLHSFSSGKHCVFGSSDARTASSRFFTWSIWDLGLATTLVAIFASSVRGIASPSAIQNQIAIALCGGMVASWSASAWAISDRWNGWRLASLGLVTVSSLALMARHAPGPLGLAPLVSWMLVGPLAVASAQGVSVLLIVALARWDATRIEAQAADSPDPLFEVRPLSVFDPN